MGAPSFDVAALRREQAPPEQIVREVTNDQFCFGFGDTLTGDISSSSNWKAILAAKPGERWIITGGEILAVVTTVLAGSAGLLRLMDGTGGTIVAPVGAYGATTAVGTTVSGWTAEPFRLVFGPEGLSSRAVNRGLYIGGTATLATGVVTYSGWIRGRFVPGAP